MPPNREADATKPKGDSPGAGASAGAGAQSDAPAGAGRFAYERLDRLIHEKARLSILSSLASHPNGLLFTDLKALCALTDGNLSRQLQQLQEAGLVEVWKGFKNKRPQTLCRLSAAGRKRFLDYVNELERVVADAASAAKTHPTSAKPAGGWLSLA